MHIEVFGKTERYQYLKVKGLALPLMKLDTYILIGRCFCKKKGSYLITISLYLYI